jgi:hypothetical protein
VASGGMDMGAMVELSMPFMGAGGGWIDGHSR